MTLFILSFFISLQGLKNRNVQPDEQESIKSVFNRNGQHTNTEVLRVVVPYNGFIETSARKYAIGNEEWNENDQICEHQSAPVRLSQKHHMS